jgi:uncharacterized protein (TIGR03437 family)
MSQEFAPCFNGCVLKSRCLMILATSSVVALWSFVAYGQPQNQILSAGYSPPLYQNVGLGQVITLFAPRLNVPDAVSSQIPPPTTLSGVSVLVRVPPPADGSKYPSALGILRIYSPNEDTCGSSDNCPTTQITVQIPMDRVCLPPVSAGGCPTVPPPQIILNIKANGVSGPDFTLTVSAVGAHLLNSCDSVFGPPAVSCSPLITHADGTMVSGTNPAKVGEIITVWAVGLAVQGGNAAGGLVFRYLLVPDQKGFQTTYVYDDIEPTWAGLTPGYVGLYQINFKVPPAPAPPFQCAGTSQYNATFNSIVNFNQTVGLCVQP